MAQFSTAVKLGDLNDFIAPAQACVVSLQGGKPTTKQQHAAAVAAESVPAASTPAVAAARVSDGDAEGLRLHVRASSKPATAGLQGATAAAAPAAVTTGGFKQTTVDEATQAVKVSLADCLACSGCVTSAETVLLQHQSLKEFAAKCADPDVNVVVTVSPQSRAALAAINGLSPEDVQGRVAAFLKHQLSVALVLDLGLGSALALTEAAVEFVSRYRQAHATQPVNEQRAAAPPPQQQQEQQQQQQQKQEGGVGRDVPLPVLASACPGWVCYAEKDAAAGSLLRHLAAPRSPQAVMGALVKRCLAPRMGWAPSAVYHVAVMPCYDKKLEAARPDLALPDGGSPEVDSCLTTGELQQLLESHGLGNLAAAPGGRWDDALALLRPGCERLPAPRLHMQHGSSGGYATHVFVAAARALYGIQLPARAALERPATLQQQQQQQPALQWRALRNADMQELRLLDADGTPLLRVAAAYGFRNIQALVRRLRSPPKRSGGVGSSTSWCEHDYVEVMACPGGCLNGGGQLRPPPGVPAAAHLDALERAFLAGDAAAALAAPSLAGPAAGLVLEPGAVRLMQPLQQPLPPPTTGAVDGQSWPWAWAVPACACEATLRAVYEEVVGGPPGSLPARALLHTGFHARERSTVSTLSDW